MYPDMYPDQLVSGQLIQIYTVFKTSYTQVQHGMGHPEPEK